MHYDMFGVVIIIILFVVVRCLVLCLSSGRSMFGVAPGSDTGGRGVCVCAVVMFGCVIGLFYCRVCHLIHQALASQPSKGHDTFDVYSKI